GMEARRRKASALRLRFPQSLASLRQRKGTGSFEQWQNVGKYYLRVDAPKTQCPGATSAPCMCELRRKPLPSRKRNRRSIAAVISVTLAAQDPYLIRRRRLVDDVVTGRRGGGEDHLDQIAWRAGLFMVNGGNTASYWNFFDQRQLSALAPEAL